MRRAASRRPATFVAACARPDVPGRRRGATVAPDPPQEPAPIVTPPPDPPRQRPAAPAALRGAAAPPPLPAARRSPAGIAPDGGARSLGGIWFPASGFLSLLLRDGRGVETEVAMVGARGLADVQGLGDPPGRGPLAAHGAATGRPRRSLASRQLAGRDRGRPPALSDVLRIASRALFAQTAATRARRRPRPRGRAPRPLAPDGARPQSRATRCTSPTTGRPPCWACAARGCPRRCTGSRGTGSSEPIAGGSASWTGPGLIAATNGLYALGEPRASTPPARAGGPGAQGHLVGPPPGALSSRSTPAPGRPRGARPRPIAASPGHASRGGR